MSSRSSSSSSAACATIAIQCLFRTHTQHQLIDPSNVASTVGREGLTAAAASHPRAPWDGVAPELGGTRGPGAGGAVLAARGLPGHGLAAVEARAAALALGAPIFRPQRRQHLGLRGVEDEPHHVAATHAPRRAAEYTYQRPIWRWAAAWGPTL